MGRDLVEREGERRVDVLDADVLDSVHVTSKLPLLEGRVTTRWPHDGDEAASLLGPKEALLEHGKRPKHEVDVSPERILTIGGAPGDLTSVHADERAWRNFLVV